MTQDLCVSHEEKNIRDNHTMWALQAALGYSFQTTVLKDCIH